ncbi:MAG: hypothetical protein ACYC49_00205 [Ignavibacteriaceae bacterium]
MIEGFGWCIGKLKKKINSFREFLVGLRKRKIIVVVISIVIIAIIFGIAKLIADQIELPIFKTVVWIISVSSKISGTVQ